ncbi:AraC family transcriptional regulator [Paenibacillus radicis (ex Xue et al. 2023)]|uniref:AraC family transcriptional regulator n=1 Tax=Paenibacillus radicis (ex Xue et al. 2023) TaxID=2972489 RepID=A0ABT1YLJ2_9BACL|nr:AraC family transcriptional regulator [Paenibacillus radicis (ex Xue et al. 2023)]MCR8634029.1 AraC family transcriptional regulator [Paenibacillus radicis (ex Xue et al. 2023)]
MKDSHSSKMKLAFSSDHGLFHLDHSIRTGPYNMTQNHSHDSFEIYYMRAGERFYFIKDRSYHVKRGDLVLIQPNVLHKTTESYSPNHERVLINFKTAFVTRINNEIAPDLLQIFEEGPVLHPDARELIIIESIMDKMLREQKQGEPDAEGYIKLLLGELMLLINRHIRQTDRKSKTSEHPTTLHRKVSDMVVFINENYREPLSLKSLAEHFHISPFYLCRIYKEVTGFTVVEYVNQVRVQEAQVLLKTTRSSVTDITEKVGFESSTHFGRIFKTLCGMSPLQYRKLNKT